jgi:hypothetical protein
VAGAPPLEPHPQPQVRFLCDQSPKSSPALTWDHISQHASRPPY